MKDGGEEEIKNGGSDIQGRFWPSLCQPPIPSAPQTFVLAGPQLPQPRWVRGSKRKGSCTGGLLGGVPLWRDTEVETANVMEHFHLVCGTWIGS